MGTKKTIRKEAKQIRGEFSSDKVRTVSSELCERLLSMECYQNASEIFVYSAIGNEIDLTDVIYASLKEGKRIAFPKVFGNDMEFFYVDNLGQLEKGNFGILEPLDICKKAHLGDNSIILIPGLAFSVSGQRIGYGKGYYDKYLSSYNNCYKIGICYDQLYLAEWNADELDVSMNCIITEKREVWVNDKT